MYAMPPAAYGPFHLVAQKDTALCGEKGKGVDMKIIPCITAAVFLTFLLCLSAHAMCVNVGEANLRSGPGTNYKKTWQVFKYMPLRKLKRQGNWYKVKDFEGDTHWVYRKLMSDKFDCAVVKVSKANIRKGPGTGYGEKYYSPVMKYDSFKILKRKGEWVNVLDEYGEKGWIFRKLLWIY